MPAWLVPALGVAAGVFGAERANRSNRKEADKNRAFQAGEARINREFQERMRNTEWQAAVEDMRRAGINPAVAYARGGASSPGGSMAGGSLAAPAGDAIGKGVSSAMEVSMFRKNMQLLDAQISKTQQEASTAGSTAQNALRASQFDARRYEYYFDENGRPKGPLKDLFDAEFQTSIANSARSISDAELTRLSIPERKAMATMFDQLGASPKMLQIAMPFILQLMRGPGR